MSFGGQPEAPKIPPPPPPAPLPSESQARLDELARQQELLRSRRVARDDFIVDPNQGQAGLRIP